MDSISDIFKSRDAAAKQRRARQRPTVMAWAGMNAGDHGPGTGGTTAAGVAAGTPGQLDFSNSADSGYVALIEDI